MATEIKNIFISQNKNIRYIMKKLDRSAQKILLVVDRAQKLLGVITDGDVRRCLLKNGSMDEKAFKIMNKSPIFAEEGFKLDNIKSIMKNKKIECVPIVDKNMKVVSALWWTDFFDTKTPAFEKIKLPVVIMAGGKGTRLEPFTKVLPKALIPIGDKTIIEVIIERFKFYGCSNFYISINHKAGLIKSYFNDISVDYNVKYLQEDSFYGTAGSLRLLSPHLKTSFFVNNCDIIIDCDYSDILKFHKKNGNIITVVCSMRNFKIPYGVVETFANGMLKKIREKPEFDFLVNTGMYIIDQAALNFIPAGKVYHMTDLIADCKKSGRRIGVYPISENAWTDIGQMKELFLTFNKLGI